MTALRSLKSLKLLDVEKIEEAIEADAGKPLALLRESLAEAKTSESFVTHKPEDIGARRRGRPLGSKQAVTKQPVKLRLDSDVLTALRASGAGWQTRINDMLRASLNLNNQIKEAKQ